MARIRKSDDNWSDLHGIDEYTLYVLGKRYLVDFYVFFNIDILGEKDRTLYIDIDMYPSCDDFTIIRIYHWNPLDHDLFELFDLFIDTRESILSQFGTHHHPNAKIQKY